MALEEKDFMDFSTVFRHNPQCPVREIGSGFVIMAPTGDTTHSLEDLGAFIWRHLDGEKDLQSIQEDITREYEVDEKTARNDLIAFITQLQEAGLIVRS